MENPLKESVGFFGQSPSWSSHQEQRYYSRFAEVDNAPSHASSKILW